MSAEPIPEAVEDRSEYAGVLRFYELAKHQEWAVRDLPWGDLPPVPEGKGSPAAAWHGAATCGARS